MSQGNIDVLMGLGNPLNWDIGDPFDVILRTEAVLNLREAVQEREDDGLARTVFPLLEQAQGRHLLQPFLEIKHIVNYRFLIIYRFPGKTTSPEQITPGYFSWRR